MDAIGNFVARYARNREEELTLDQYLAECKREPLAYASAAERMLTAIGEPQMLDTRNDPRLSRIFANKVIKIYPAFAEFYGLEDAIEQVVSYFRHAAQGLEERKQILYLLGPVGGGKSSIAERLKQLMQHVPFSPSRAPRSMRARWACLTRLKTGRFCRPTLAFQRAICNASCHPGPSNGWTSMAATSASSRWSSATPAS